MKIALTIQTIKSFYHLTSNIIFALNVIHLTSNFYMFQKGFWRGLCMGNIFPVCFTSVIGVSKDAHPYQISLVYALMSWNNLLTTL